MYESLFRVLRTYVTIVCIIIVYVMGGMMAQIPDYLNYCNKTVTLNPSLKNESNLSGVLVYNLDATKDTCSTQVKSMYSNHSIRYQVRGLLKCQCQFCGNNNSVTVTGSHERHEFCPGYLSHINIHQTRSGWLNSGHGDLDIDIYNINSAIPPFHIQFYIFHSGDCLENEVSCNGCMLRTLACDHKLFKCDVGNICSGTNKASTSLIVALVIGGVACVLVFFICCAFMKRNKLSCFRDSTRSNSECMSTRDSDIFTVQLASRGVTSDDEGNDNAAYTEDGERIDPSLLQPPPEYSSLENIDQQGKSYPDNADLPPSYDDALENREKYKVAIDIPDNT